MKMKPLRNWIYNKLDLHKRIYQLKGNPSHIARGYSLGLFIGLMPLVGIKAFIAVAIASILKWNKLAATIGVFHTNPLTAPFLFSITYWLGKPFTGAHTPLPTDNLFSSESIRIMLGNGWDMFLSMWVGGFLLGIPLAFVSYHLLYFSIKRISKQKAHTS